MTTLLTGVLVAWTAIGSFYRAPAINEESVTSEAFTETVDQTTPTPKQTPEDQAPSSEFRLALDNIWISADKYRIGEYKIARICPEDDDSPGECELTIKQSGKIVGSFEVEQGHKDWLQYGFFNFLGKKDKQLVVHTFSGGAHCCYDYAIYDLQPVFRTIYSSGKYDSANQIGNELVPFDIDKDGRFEFYQDVMAFDYIGPGGHATATFPPAIFAFNSKNHKFELANSRFSQFVLDKLKENIDNLREWKLENEKHGDKITENDIEEITVRETFLYWVYAGKRNEGWEYFETHYKSETGNQYQDEFRDKFRKDFENLFAQDPTYRSIYDR